MYDIVKVRAALKQGSDASRLNVAVALRTLADMDREVNRDMQAALSQEKQSLAIFEDILQHPKTDEKGQGHIDQAIIRDNLADVTMRVGVTSFVSATFPRPPITSKNRCECNAAGSTKRRPQTPNSTRSIRCSPSATGRPFRRRCGPEGEWLVNTKTVGVKLNTATSLLALGDTAYRLSDAGAAKKSFDESIKTYDDLLTQNPKVPFLQRRLSNASMLIGDFCLRTGDNDHAGEHFRRARTLLGELVDTDPKKFDYKWDLTFAHYRLGQHALRTNNAAEAKKQFEECRKIREQSAARDKINERRQMELMLVLAHCGDHAQAATIATKLEKTVKVDAEFLIDLTRTYAQCSTAANIDAPLKRTTSRRRCALRGRPSARLPRLGLSAAGSGPRPDSRDERFLPSFG